MKFTNFKQDLPLTIKMDGASDTDSASSNSTFTLYGRNRGARGILKMDVPDITLNCEYFEDQAKDVVVNGSEPKSYLIGPAFLYNTSMLYRLNDPNTNCYDVIAFVPHSIFQSMDNLEYYGLLENQKFIISLLNDLPNLMNSNSTLLPNIKNLTSCNSVQTFFINNELVPSEDTTLNFLRYPIEFTSKSDIYEAIEEFNDYFRWIKEYLYSVLTNTLGFTNIPSFYVQTPAGTSLGWSDPNHAIKGKPMLACKAIINSVKSYGASDNLVQGVVKQRLVNENLLISYPFKISTNTNSADNTLVQRVHDNMSINNLSTCALLTVLSSVNEDLSIGNYNIVNQKTNQSFYFRLDPLHPSIFNGEGIKGLKAIPCMHPYLGWSAEFFDEQSAALKPNLIGRNLISPYVDYDYDDVFLLPQEKIRAVLATVLKHSLATRRLRRSFLTKTSHLLVVD